MFPEFCREPCLDHNQRHRHRDGLDSSGDEHNNNNNNKINPVADLISKIQNGFCNPEHEGVVARPGDLVETTISNEFANGHGDVAVFVEARGHPCFHLMIPPRFSACDNDTTSCSSVETTPRNHDDHVMLSQPRVSILRSKKQRQARITNEVDTGQSERIYRIVETQVCSVLLVAMVLLTLCQLGHRFDLTVRSALLYGPLRYRCSRESRCQETRKFSFLRHSTKSLLLILHQPSLPVRHRCTRFTGCYKTDRPRSNSQPAHSVSRGRKNKASRREKALNIPSHMGASSVSSTMQLK